MPGTMNDDEVFDAGDFSSWVTNMQGALRGEHGSDVPCGTCTACCTGSQFVHIAPDETDALSRIPAALLFPAPRMPRGHVLLGYDERGRCPMLIDDKCSIYEHRPRTCRVYDCRVFPAAGVGIDDADKVLIDEQAKRWRFSYSTDDGRVRHEAVLTAATFLDEHAAALFDGAAAPDATQRAVLAVEMHAVFVGRTPDPTEVRVELSRRRGSRPFS